VFKPFGGQLGISSPVSDTNPFPTLKTNKRGKILKLLLVAEDGGQEMASGGLRTVHEERTAPKFQFTTSMPEYGDISIRGFPFTSELSVNLDLFLSSSIEEGTF
jgi:hypothetical protein